MRPMGQFLGFGNIPARCCLCQGLWRHRLAASIVIRRIAAFQCSADGISTQWLLFSFQHPRLRYGVMYSVLTANRRISSM